jgi:Uma2 family endonuclease
LPDSFQSLALYRFTVDKYERMAPVLDDRRVELVDGYVIRKIGKRPPHIWSVGRIFKALEFLRTDRWTCRKEDPIRIPDFDEPEPDIAVIRGPDVDYQDRIPQAADVALVVEVAESTLERDQGLKLAAYAKGGIPTYWIVNLVERKIQVYTSATAVGYDTRIDFVAGHEVPVVLDGVEVGKIAVDGVLPNQVPTD